MSVAPTERLRVFISYAHVDGVVIAQRLATDLRERSCNVWLDEHRLTAGATWTTEIETALDDTEIVLALLTPGSYVSEICRAEQLRALRKNKCPIPVLGAKRTACVPARVLLSRQSTGKLT